MLAPMPTCPAPNRSAHQPTFHGCLCSWDELLALGAPPPCDTPPAGIQDWCHAYRPSRLFAYGMALEATGGDSDAILAELGAAYNALSACEVRPPITPHSSHPNTFLPSHHIHKRLYTLRPPVSMSVLPTGGRVQMSGRYDACFVPRAIGTCSGEAWRPPWRGESTTRTDFPPASMPQTLPSSCVGAYLAQSHQPAQLAPLL